MAYRPTPGEDTRDHNTEVMSAHEGAPSVGIQSKTHGAPSPAPDNGTAPGTVVG